MAMSLKPITVRLPEDDLELARKEAEALGVSVGVYLRMLFRQSLRNTPGPLKASPLEAGPLEVRQRRAEALRQFGEVMPAELEAQGVSEDDAVRLAKEARKRLANERRGQS